MSWSYYTPNCHLARPPMDNPTALQEFERHLRRRFPERSTPIHYVSDVRQFQRVCPKPWAEVTRADVDAFVDAGLAQGWRPATLARRVGGTQGLLRLLRRRERATRP